MRGSLRGSVLLFVAVLLGTSCGKKSAATATTSTSSSASTGTGGVGGGAALWTLLYEGTEDAEPNAIALLPSGIVVELASQTAGNMATLGTLPYAGGTPTTFATVGTYDASDSFALATDGTSIVFAGTNTSGERLATLPAAGRDADGISSRRAR